MLHPFSRIFGLGDKSEVDVENEFHPDEVIYVPISQIEPNRFQPRSVFQQEKIDELAPNDTYPWDDSTNCSSPIR